MNKMRKLQLRAISLVLALTMAIGCTFNTAAADSTLTVDSGLIKDSALMMMELGSTQEIKADVNWSRSRETDQVGRNIADTDWDWNTAGEIKTSLTDPEQIWDAGTTNQYFKDYAPQPGYRAATWQYVTNKPDGAKMDLRRFHGEFTLPDNFQPTDTIQYRSENQDKYKDINDGNVIPINDDIFIFCYPKGMTLTNDNYMDYLAFWSGTSGKRDKEDGTPGADEKKFHDIDSTLAHQTNASREVMRLTDGWYVEADLDNIGKSLFQNSSPQGGDSYVIDIFTQEYAVGGGMDEPEIIISHNQNLRLQAQNDSYQTAPGVPVNLDILQNDKVYPEGLSILPSLDMKSLTGASGTTLKADGNGGYIVKQKNVKIGSLTIDADGIGTFTPSKKYTGTVKFKYTACLDYNDKQYRADAYVTINVKNVTLNKTAEYKGNFNSEDGTGSRTYDLTLSASVTVPAAEETTYKWYSDKACTNEITVTDKTGSNPLYLKTTSTTQGYVKVYQGTVNQNKGKPYYIQSGSDYHKVEYYKSGIGHLRSGWYFKYYDFFGVAHYDGPYKPKASSNSEPGTSGIQFYDYDEILVDQYTKIDIPKNPDKNTDYYVEECDCEDGYSQVYFKAETSGGTAETITDATIQDMIDPRFELTAESKSALELEENTSVETVNGKQTIVWSKQEIGSATTEWRRTITVKAKDEFFGGNDIATNVKNGSYVNYDNEDGSNVKAEFPQPTVNVPIYFKVNPAQTTNFYGEKISDGVGSADIQNSMVVLKGQDAEGQITEKWYYDENCTEPAEGLEFDTIKNLTLDKSENKYYLKVAFEPNTTGEKSQKAHGGNPVKTESKTGTYTVNVVKGQLEILKTIKGTATDPKQFFTFKIERYAPNDTKCTGSVLSTSYEVIYTTDGTGSKTTINLPQGNYKVTEIKNSAWRYTLHTSTPQIQTVYLGRNNPVTNPAFSENATVKYENYLSNDKWISGKDSVTNVFTANVPAA